MKTRQEILKNRGIHETGGLLSYPYIMEVLEEYGKECYNQAINDAWEVSAKEYLEESLLPILKLKKE